MTGSVVYLAGPMRGLPDYNYPAFHKAAAKLRDGGYTVLSPAEHDEHSNLDPAKDLHIIMQWDLYAVLRSDAVVLLPGWRSSTGTAIEMTVAGAIGIPCLEYPELLPPQEETVSQEAHRLVHGARQNAYGHPADDFARTGRMWGAILGIPDVTPALVGLCLAAVKISREVNAPKHDNLVDLCGYAETVELVRQREQEHNA
jgi:nucleoside 2-deoxyribosyltransferase